MIRAVITQPDALAAPHVHAVRLHYAPTATTRHFDACFLVTELDQGTTLHVSMFLARATVKPPGVRWWRDFAAQYFPRAECVSSERLDPAAQARRPWLYRFRPTLLERVALAALAGGRL